MQRHYAVVLFHIVLLLLSGLLLRYSVTPDGSVTHKALAGFFIGTYSMFGKEIAKLFIVSGIRRAWPVFDVNKWSNRTVIATLIILALAGAVAWAVSWEGSTGIWFGLAVFAAALLSDAGVAPLVAEFYPAPKASGA
jgi:hypothetical protein